VRMNVTVATFCVISANNLPKTKPLIITWSIGLKRYTAPMNICKIFS